jgi:hypothetical protein
VNRIFLVLATIANSLLVATLALGWRIGDPRAVDPATSDALSLHFLVALGTSLLVLLVHAVALTYFMGTGRWIEETSEAYRLGDEPRRRNIKLKYRVIPGSVICFCLLLATGSLGAASDPASRSNLANASSIHFVLACTLLATNFVVSWIEYQAIVGNGRIVSAIVDEVRRIRREKGLDPASAGEAAAPAAAG